MTRNWNEATTAMKRVPSWYKRRIAYYVISACIVFFGLGYIIGRYII